MSKKHYINASASGLVHEHTDSQLYLIGVAVAHQDPFAAHKDLPLIRGAVIAIVAVTVPHDPLHLQIGETFLQVSGIPDHIAQVEDLVGLFLLHCPLHIVQFPMRIREYKPFHTFVTFLVHIHIIKRTSINYMEGCIMNQPDPTLEALKKDPQAAKLLGDPATLKSLLSSPETQKLMSLLNQKAGSGLQSAAQAAAKGKPAELMDLLNQVIGTPEGASAMEGLQKKTKS